MSKTPRFDAALEPILSSLTPHERTCGECKKAFPLEAGDIEFLKKLRVPPPRLCPRCRMQRRLAFRTSLKPVFHKKTCSAPGHAEKVISFYGEENPVKVFDEPYYRSDAWDSLQYGKEVRPGEPFFEQFKEFVKEIPHQALNQDPHSVGSDYSVSGKAAKDCYYTAVPYYAENLQYGSSGFFSKDSLDFLDLDSSEWCFNSVRVESSYNCSFCVDVSDCIDSAFLYDARNSNNCFASTNLRNRQYVFLNEQLTKEEYQKRRGEINLGSWKEVQIWRKKFEELVASAIHKNLDVQKVENSEGNQLRGCKNCFDAFRFPKGGENVRHCAYGDNIKDCVDVWGGANMTESYEATGIPDATKTYFSWMIRTGREVEYSGECSNIDYCFGCFGLKNKKYCIFNVQYTEEEYWKKVDEIKTAMLERGEYGEFVPMSFSPRAYNESNAYIEFPLAREEAVVRGLAWRDPDALSGDLSQMNVLKADGLPDDISSVGEEILGSIIACKETGRPFRITPYEFGFYKKQKLPLPRLHPDVRIEHLLAQRFPYRLWDDTCKKCGKEMKSGYDPKKNLRVYCEACYQAEIV